jgi:molybdenum cofactor cytidylyltransferase
VAATIRALLLCAGRSSRFGSDKLLAPIAHQRDRAPMAVLAARHAIAGTGNALAIIAPGSSELGRLLAKAGCEVLESADTSRGLGASLAAGVAHAHDAGGWIVALGDMPFIDPQTFALILTELRAGAIIAAPVDRATHMRGHPVGFSAALKPELLALDGDEGARSILHRHRHQVAAVAVDDRGILMDIDTPGDLDAATSS